MGNLAKFEAFKLNKVQMNAIAGGKIQCRVTYSAALGGGSFDLSFGFSFIKNVSS